MQCARPGNLHSRGELQLGLHRGDQGLSDTGRLDRTLVVIPAALSLGLFGSQGGGNGGVCRLLSVIFGQQAEAIVFGRRRG